MAQVARREIEESLRDHADQQRQPQERRHPRREPIQYTTETPRAQTESREPRS